jgi:tetratricopeptide (TPR) repeat protein
MPQFLFRAKDATGEVTEDRLEAATLGQARYTLELRGFTDIEFFSTENVAEVQRMALSGTGLEDDPPGDVPASVEISAQGNRGVLAQFFWALRWHMIFLGPLLLWNFLSWRGDRPLGWGDWLGFVLTPLYLLVFVKMILPLTIFTILLEAAVWQNWPKQARCIRLARFLRRFMRTGIPENELLFREAHALAAQGNLSGALLHVEPLRGHPDVSEYMFLARLGSVYEYAGDFATQLRCAEQAAAKQPDSADPWIDLASVRIRHFRDVAGAKAALEKAEDKDLSEMARAFLLLTKGMIAVEDLRMAEAEAHLREAAGVFRKFGIALIQALEAELQAYLALALAAQGRGGEGRADFARVRPLLVAGRMEQLVGRVDVALGAG